MADKTSLTRRMNAEVKDRQYVLGQFEARIAETDLYIAALEARKLELQNV